MQHTPRPPARLHRRTFLSAALLAWPGFAMAQDIESVLNTPNTAPPPPPPPVQKAPEIVLNPDASWAWLLEKAQGTEPATLLAAGGPGRAVITAQWSAQGQFLFAGSSPDAAGKAGLDLADRLIDTPYTGQASASEATLWAGWHEVGMSDGYEDSQTRTWITPQVPLAAALVGERRRAQRMDIGQAGAVIAVFPFPGTPTSHDVVPNGGDLPELAPILARMTDPKGPVPIAGIRGVRQSWLESKGLGGQGLYRAANGTSWAFWILAP